MQTLNSDGVGPQALAVLVTDRNGLQHHVWKMSGLASSVVKNLDINVNLVL